MLKELVLKNRSFRGYDGSFQLSRGELLELVDLTRYTASTVNAQPLKYYIACEREEVEKILSLTLWAKALKDVQLPHPGMGPSAFIVICQDMSIGSGTTRFLRDIGIAAQTILLGAVEKGLGGCMIGSFRKPELKELLSLPEEIEPNLVLALGKPAEKIVLTEVSADGDTTYYRDENDVHYVPKRKLEDLIL
ncbi:nitroreductase [Lachnoclostridium sp. An131]|uniref:nitroreductase family protein n=1 Tax=Lachnoclostridium sp. An131 TaxID=1965555 RepID=UPI000B38C41E|nr:nitroreductase family protein [Lachnoclostridium sp. An131]OUQ24871.1 nitroreductase [Lachnoclostridium sp. An131]